jgi:hypothetical protein
MYQPIFTIDVAFCFVLRANRSLVGAPHNNGLFQGGTFYTVNLMPDYLHAFVQLLSKECWCVSHKMNLKKRRK